MALKGGKITALANAPSGSALVALKSGQVVELDQQKSERIVLAEAAPAGIAELLTDRFGQVWAVADHRTYRKPAAAGAWQRNWELAARLPGSNHDLAGEAIGAKFYVAGGQTATWGYPAVAHVFDGLYEFDLAKRTWRIAAQLGRPRFYAGVAALDGRVLGHWRECSRAGCGAPGNHG